MISLLLSSLAAAGAPPLPDLADLADLAEPRAARLAQEPAPAGEPFLQWSGEAEDEYRRALHLWQVRGKPGEAAGLLLALSEQSVVIEHPGQASWVLALAARALSEAGRAEEAAALLPGIERGARGTDFEAYVRRELEPLRQGGLGELDAGFLDSLTDILNEEYSGESAGASYRNRIERVQRYQRSVLPYLLDIVDRWPSENVQQATVARAIEIGLSMADAGFVDGLIELAGDMTTLSFLTVIPMFQQATMDEIAQAEALRFYLAFAHHPDLERVLLAKQVVGYRAFRKREQPAQQACRALLQDADDRGDEVLLGSVSASEPQDPADLVRECARLPNPAIADRARMALLSRKFLDDLREFAASGSERDVARYLLLLLRYAPQAVNSAEDGRRQWGNAFFVQGSRFRDLNDAIRDGWPSGGPARPGSGWKPHPSFDGFAFLRTQGLDGEMRTLLALAAAAVQDEEGFALAYEGGPPSDELTIVQQLSRQRYLPEAMLPRLFRIPDSDLAFQEQWSLLTRQKPERLSSASLELIPASAYSDSMVQQLNSALLEHGKIGDAIAVCMDPRTNWSVHQSFFANTQQLRPVWLQHLDGLLQLLARIDPQHRDPAHSYVQNLFLQVTSADRSGMGAEELATILEKLYAAEKPCWIARWILEDWSGAGRAATERFARDEGRFEWLAQTAVAHLKYGEQIDFIRYCLERDAPAEWFESNSTGMGAWISEDADELLEVAELLLRREDAGSRALGMACLQRRPQDAERYWDLVDRNWGEPSLAHQAAALMSQAQDRDRLVAGLQKAWAVPGMMQRDELMKTISNVADARLAPILLGALSHANPAIAGMARDGLQRLKEIEEQRAFWDAWQATGVGGSPTGALLRQIQSENKEVRLSAIRALGAVRAPEALPLLIGLLEDPDAEVAAAARVALRWIEAPPAPK